MSYEHGFFAVPEDFLHVSPPAGQAAGQSHGSKSLYPPPPRTWQGMVRTRILVASGLRLSGPTMDRREIERLVGRPESLPEGWSFDGPWPAETMPSGNITAWFPTPMWIHALDEAGPTGGQSAQRARERWFEGGSGSSTPAQPGWKSLKRGVVPNLPELLSDEPPMDRLHVPGHATRGPLGGFVRADLMLAMLAGRDPGTRESEEIEQRLHLADLPPTAAWEIRPGLNIAENLQPYPGMLYFLTATRHRARSGLASWLTTAKEGELPARALTEGLLRGGRKGRALTLHPLGTIDGEWAKLRKGEHLSAIPSSEELWFWLYLASPAFIDHPSRPIIPLASIMVSVSIRAALLCKPLILGGIRRTGGGRVQPLDNLPYVPAGSAWLCHMTGGGLEDRKRALQALHNRCALGRPEEWAFGFGRVLVGLMRDDQQGGRA